MLARHLFFLLTIALVATTGGCQLDDRVDLLRIVRIQPGSVSAGERITVWGEGFPEGRDATVVFQGDVFRPGAPPERDVRFVTKAKPGQRNSVTFVFDGDLERRLAGGASSSTHSTFRGSARVVFEPTARGVASIAGTYRGLVLETIPSVQDQEVLARRAAAGRDTLDYLGASTTAGPAGTGLRIAVLDPAGRLYRGGLRAGDRIVEFGGVTVMTLADLRPVPGERSGHVVVERDGRMLPAFTVDVQGAAPPGAHTLALGGALVLVVCILLAFLASPFAPAARLYYRLAALRRRPPFRRSARTLREPSVIRQLAPCADAGPAIGIAASLVLGLVAVGFASLSLGRPVLSREIDLVVAVPAASVVLLFSRFVDGGFGRSRTWSFTAAFAAALRTLGCILPAVVAVAAVVFSTGRFVLDEVVADQGGVPWRWAAARNPGLLIAFVVFVAMAIPESGYRGVVPAEGFEPGSLPRTTSRALVRLAEWTYLFVVCGVACALFLGGWRVPTVAYMTQESSRRLEVLGAVLFFAKFAAMVGVVSIVRRGFAHLFLDEISGVFARWGFAASLLGACLAVGWAAGFDGARTQVPADILGVAVSGLGTVGLLAVALAWLRKEPSGASLSTVNPWL